MDEKTFADASEVEHGPRSHDTIKIDGEVVLITDSTVQRIPIASADPNDPLNFTKWRKLGILVTTCWFCMSAEVVTILSRR